MSRLRIGLLLCWVLLSQVSSAQEKPEDEKVVFEAEKDGEEEACDWNAYMQAAFKVDKLRKDRRLSAKEFARMAKEPRTIVLDARDARFFKDFHVKGSVNLPYTQFAEETLKRVIKDKSTRILIYCRNNIMLKEPPPLSDRDFQFRKASIAGLNIPTFITLYLYGYENVWELDSVADPNNSEIEFEFGE